MSTVLSEPGNYSPTLIFFFVLLVLRKSILLAIKLKYVYLSLFFLHVEGQSYISLPIARIIHMVMN